MKKNLQILSVLMAVLFSFAQAQITITASDAAAAFSIGTMETIASDTVGGMYDIGSPGGGNNWDFSAVVARETFTQTYVDPATTPFSSDFSGATVASFLTVEVDGIMNELYAYLSIGNSIEDLGSGSTISSPQLNGTSTTVYDPPGLDFVFPATFGSSWAYQGTTTTTSMFDGIPPITQESSMSSADEIDAFGTLILPGGESFEALRVVERDTTTTEVVPGFPVTTISTSFTFVGKSGEFFNVSAFDGNSPTSGLSEGAASWTAAEPTAIEPIGTIATEFALKQNYPNPFNPSTTIEYSISSSSFVNLRVYDILGKEIAILVNENQPAGAYRATFDAADLPSGIYFVHMKAGNFSQVRKMSLLK